MQRLVLSIAVLVLSCGCAGEHFDSGSRPTQVSVSPPASDQIELALRVVSEECARLIGSINAGIELVDKLGKSDSDERQFEDSAVALDAVARALESSVYHTPDLRRLAGFYVGVAKGQASITREINALLVKGSEADLQQAQNKLQTLSNMEDTVISELNQRCRGISTEGR